ncbi:MAG: Coenzyme F420 hydrogenase/dehydrogenase, beta subunit C-terminal domain [Oscillospiraceae bacterium]|nr:Coenzyme F420 hydrogenase/dehydrogenase, beta subunit C-terminal domain [Oscillospiraceae bacterium]
MIDIKILLFGTFDGERASIERYFQKAALTEYDTPLSVFVTTRFKTLAAEADVALMGGEPRYKSYIVAAKKAGCKAALWGCELQWLTTSLTALQQFDLIFARDRDALAALRRAGFPEVSLCPSSAPPKVSPPPDPSPVAEEPPAPESSPLTEEPPLTDEPPENDAAPPDISPTPPDTPTVPPEALGIPDEPGLLDEPEFTVVVDIPVPAENTPQEPAETPVTPVLNPYGIAPVTTVYGAANLNENIRSASSAGGVFSLLCEDMIRRGGVVFGVHYNDMFETAHGMADRIPECVPMRGAKYTESKTGSAYEQTAACLQRGTPVLFTGTACQIAELNAYLCWLPATALSAPGLYSRNEARNLSDSPLLLTADVVCTGVAEQAVFSAYLQSVEKRLGATVSAVDMSGKPRGWNKASVRIGSESGTYEVPAYRDPFMRAYRAGLCLAEKCHDCPYRTSEKRVSDLTLGTFAEGHKHIPELYDDKGASVVLAHTDKGRAAIEEIDRHRAVFCEIPPDALEQYNPTLNAAPPRHEKREQFLSECKHMPFDKAVNRCLGPVWLCILLHKRKILPPWRIIKRIHR